ncbi:MAG: cysteine peptidase family C39 domain-containing protein [Ignavibacteria bacterium]|jgi:hypothetical protein
MSFYPQPNKYQCGPFALKYALVMLGVFKNEDQIGIIAGSTWWAGTDEIGLSKSAKRFNCKMKYFHSIDSEKARKLLNRELDAGYPCILSVKNWEHWVTVINRSKDKYIVVDSEMDKVIQIKNKSQLLRYWKYFDEEEKIGSYDGYTLYPEFKRNTKAAFKLKDAKELMYKKNEMLAVKWDQYFNDLITICKPRTKLTINYITFAEFLRRNEKNIVSRVANWHGLPTYAEIKNILHNMKFVANVYDLIIPLDKEKTILIDVTSLLMMYACGKYGMDPIY